MRACLFIRRKEKIELFLTGAQTEAFIRALDETERHLLAAGMLLAWIHAPAWKIWVEKVKQQLTASLTTTVKLPSGKGLNFLILLWWSCSMADGRG